MCNPAAAGVIGLQLAGGAFSAQSQRQAGRAQEGYYRYLATQSETQAKSVLDTGEQQTTLVQGSAAEEAKNLRAQQRQFAGSQRAALAASGVPLSSVTAEDIARDTMKKEDLDAAALRYNADTKAWEIQTQARQQAQSLRDQAGAYRYAGKNAKRIGDISATTSLLGGATSVAGNWYDYGQTSQGLGPRTANVSGRTIPVAPRNYYRRS